MRRFVPHRIGSLALHFGAGFLATAAAAVELPAALQTRLEQPLSLQDCIDIALLQNRLLTAAGLERDAVHQGVDAALGTWLPVLGVSALRTSVHGNTESLGSNAPSDFAEATATDLVARLSQRLPLVERTRTCSERTWSRAKTSWPRR